MKRLRSYVAIAALRSLLFCLISASAAANDLAKVSLSYEQSEDRSNFIAQVRKARQGDAESQWQVGGVYVQLGDPIRALPMLRSAATAGHARAATLLGWLYEVGSGTERNLGEATRWYRLAAERGDARAMAALGRLLLKENSTEARQAARQLFQKSAELNDPGGQYNLGWMLASQEAGSSGDADAFGWFIRSARQGHVGAQVSAAIHLLTGRGATIDKKAAGEWIERAAESGDPVAHYLLGRLKEAAPRDQRNLDGARQSFRIAAAAGHRDAQFALAALLAESRAARDRKDALDWFARAHAAGHKKAANRLGEMYRDGEGDLQQKEKARGIFESAARDGNVDAMYNLAQMLNDGLAGPRETAEALKWYARAADEGHGKALEVVEGLLGSSVKTSALGFKGFWQ